MAKEWIGLAKVGIWAFVALCLIWGPLSRPPCGQERFDPNKMSQVAVPPQQPLWERRQQGMLIQAVPMRHTIIRLPSWDEDFIPYAVWRAGQPCQPNRP